MLALLVAACFLRRAARAAGLGRRLLLPAGAGRLHPRRRRRAGDRPAREAARARRSTRGTRSRSSSRWSARSATSSAATIAVGAAPWRSSCRCASSCRGPGARCRRRRRDRRLRGARPRRARRRGRRRRSPPGCPRCRSRRRRCGRRSTLLPAAVGLFLVCFADEVLTARSFAGRHDQHIRVDQELLAMGAAQRGGGRHPGPAGRRERLAHRGQRRDGRAQPDRRPAGRGGVVLVLLFLTGPIADLPKAVLGAIIVARVPSGSSTRPPGASCWHRPRRVHDRRGHDGGRDRRRACSRRSSSPSASRSSTSCAAARAPTTRCWAGSTASAAGPTSRVHRSARVTPGVVVYRLDDRLFFANAELREGPRARGAARPPSAPHALVLDAEGITHVDTAGLAALDDLATSLGAEGITLDVARMKDHVRDGLAAAGTVERIGAEHFHPTVRAAVSAVTPRG